MDYLAPFVVDLAIVAGVYVFSLRAMGAASAILDGLQEAIREGPREEIDTLAGHLQELAAAQVELAAQVDQLPSTWQEMHNKVRRTEERTRGAVRRAMAELEENGLESPELTEIGSQLRLDDGAGSNGGGMPSVPAGVGQLPPAAQGEPSDYQKALAYKWSRR